MSKQTLRLFAAGMLAVLLPGCAETTIGPRTAHGAAAIAGEWHAAPDDMGPVGWHQRSLVLLPNGHFASVSASYGVYEGQSRNDPSSWTRIEGRFRADGNRLYFHAETMTWWDHFESSTYPTPRSLAYPWGSLFDDATFVLDGDALTMNFNVYPADAPVPVTVRYARSVRD